MYNEDDTVVFLGPSLPVAEARRILPARYQPPARFASVYELIGSEVRTILLIDGVFHDQPAIWQRELDVAIDAGIAVFGASSMGALRAAELAKYGMIGHGVVFHWYQDNKIDGDDEVALLHGDASSQYRAMSEPLVNIRYTLEQAAVAGIVTDAELETLVRIAKRVYYPQRSFARLVADLTTDESVAHLAAPLAEYFRRRRVDIKQRDAVSLLQHVAELRRAAAPPTPRVAPFELRVQHGAVKIFDKWYARGQGYRRLEHEGRSWTLQEIASLLGSTSDVQVPALGGAGHVSLSAAACKELVFDRALRDIVIAFAARRDLVVPVEHVASARDRLCTAIAAAGHDTVSWMRACRMTAPELEQRILDEALVAWFTSELPADVALHGAELAELPYQLGPSDPGLYLKIFFSEDERRACQYVALIALLEAESMALQSFASVADAWTWATARIDWFIARAPSLEKRVQDSAHA